MPYKRSETTSKLKQSKATAMQQSTATGIDLNLIMEESDYTMPDLFAVPTPHPSLAREHQQQRRSPEQREALELTVHKEATNAVEPTMPRDAITETADPRHQEMDRRTEDNVDMPYSRMDVMVPLFHIAPNQHVIYGPGTSYQTLDPATRQLLDTLQAGPSHGQAHQGVVITYEPGVREETTGVTLPLPVAEPHRPQPIQAQIPRQGTQTQFTYNLVDFKSGQKLRQTRKPRNKDKPQPILSKMLIEKFFTEFKKQHPNKSYNCDRCQKLYTEDLQICSKLHQVCAFCITGSRLCKLCRQITVPSVALTKERRSIIRSVGAFHCPGVDCSFTGSRRALFKHMAADCEGVTRQMIHARRKAAYCPISIKGNYNAVHHKTEPIRAKPVFVHLQNSVAAFIITLTRVVDNFIITPMFLATRSDTAIRKCTIEIVTSDLDPAGYSLTCTPVDYVRNTAETTNFGGALVLKQGELQDIIARGANDSTSPLIFKIYE